MIIKLIDRLNLEFDFKIGQLCKSNSEMSIMCGTFLHYHSMLTKLELKYNYGETI